MYTNMLSLFPDVKFCYENKIKDKPRGYDLCFAIPKGKKFYGWFTYYLNNPVFFLVDTNKKIIHYKYTSFNPILCNTVIYGTQLYFKSNETFTIEDVLIFQSKYINLNKLKGLPYSQNILIFLVDNKVSREDAYQIVQRCALETWNGDKTFKENLLNDSLLKKLNLSSKIDKIFSNNDLSKKVELIFKRSVN